MDQSKQIQSELDKKVYYLKTLYDVGIDLFSTVDADNILSRFLLMAMGNFGVASGFIAAFDLPSGDMSFFKRMGFLGTGDEEIQDAAKRRVLSYGESGSLDNVTILTEKLDFDENGECACSFRATRDLAGLCVLGSRLTQVPYSDEDRELLITLVNNLVIALRNAKSFEDITRLNETLRENNLELERALRDLQAALRKIEILEAIKANLSKFVPVTVSRMIETAPDSAIPEGKEQDVSVLFLDIQGSTIMSEKLGDQAVNELIEQYFSVFMDAIYANNGDVNETAGDGLMVLFLNEDRMTNAVEAVGTALTILEKAAAINRRNRASSESLIINMGVNSGLAPVGASRFDSLIGSRWTYTARGLVTSIAKRIGDVATDGSVLISKSTAERIGDQFATQFMGGFDLKNVSDSVEIFRVEGRAP